MLASRLSDSRINTGITYRNSFQEEVPDKAPNGGSFIKENIIHYHKERKKKTVQVCDFIKYLRIS